jgi:hypothetical protein
MKNPSSGMLRHVVLGRTDVSEERSVSIIRMSIIGELGSNVSATLLRSVGSSRSHTASHPRRRHSSFYTQLIFMNLLIFFVSCVISPR